MSESGTGMPSVEIVKGTNNYSLLLHGQAKTTWNVGLYRMTPSGPTLQLGTTVTLDDRGNGQFDGLEAEEGLYLARLVSHATASNFPALGDSSTAHKLWIGDQASGNLNHELDKALSAQLAYRDREIRAPQFAGDNRLRVQVLVEGCRLDYQQLFEGGFLTPLGFELGPEAVLNAVHQFLEVRFTDTSKVRTDYGREHPLCLVTFVNVQAATLAQAVEAITPRLTRVLSALAENRGATPKAIAFVSDRGGNYDLWVPTGIYRGNLVPGFGPGATFLFDAYDRAIQNEPWIGFALDIMRAVRLQTNQQTQLFMAWSLVEAAAKRTIPRSNTPVLDDGGIQLLGSRGRPLTLEQDLGRVIVYLRDHVGRGMLAMPAGSSPDFYDQLRLAYQCRNQIAHEGGIDVPGSVPIAGYSAQFAFTVRDWAAEVVRHEAMTAAV